MKLRVLVTGDRYWRNRAAIQRELLKRRRRLSLVIHGGAPGADTLTDNVCKELGLPRKRVPAEWTKYGRAAGPIRNQKMLDEYRPNLVLAFHSNIKKSKGTKDMIERANSAGIKVILFSR